MPMGRPTKYSLDLQKRICDKLKRGCSRTAAVGTSGIDYVTFLSWMANNSIFSNAVHDAESVAEELVTNRLFEEATNPNGDWRATVEFLKRRRNKDWGDQTKTELTGVNGGPVQIESKTIDELKQLPADELLRVHRETLGLPE